MSWCFLYLLVCLCCSNIDVTPTLNTAENSYDNLFFVFAMLSVLLFHNLDIFFQLQTVDKRLQKMKPPDFIVRLPRSLEANLHHLKGNCSPLQINLQQHTLNRRLLIHTRITLIGKILILCCSFHVSCELITCRWHKIAADYEDPFHTYSALTSTILNIISL